MTEESELNQRIQAHQARYEAAAHAMMTGVGYMIEYAPDQTSTKQMKTGLNSAQVSVAALGNLMIEKGIITPEEYYKAMADQMEIERLSYERMISDLHGGGTKITLH